MPTLPVFLPQRDQLDVLLAGELGGAVEAAVGEDHDVGAIFSEPESSRRASATASSTRVGPSPGAIVSSASRSVRWWSVSPQATRGCGPAAMIASSSPSRMPSISRRPSALAASSRLGQHVAGVHARRVVHDQHQPARPRLLPSEDRVGQGEDQQRQERQLQQQRDPVPQPLPERPRLLLLEDLLPEQQVETGIRRSRILRM